MRPMYTYIMNMNRKPQQYIKLTWIMVVRMASMRHIYTFTIIINTFYIIVKGRVAGILRPKSTYYIITTTITSFIATKTFTKRPIPKI